MEEAAVSLRSLDAYDGRFTFKVEDVLEIPEKDEEEKRITLLSDEYHFCGLKFQLGVQLRGSFDGSEYIAVKLFNLSSSPVLLEYSVALLPTCTRADDITKHIYEWKDPEGVVRFDAVDGMDSAWGNEEFIALEEALMDHRLLVHYSKKSKTFIEQVVNEQNNGEMKSEVGEVEVEREVEVPSLIFQCNLSVHSYVDFSNQPLTKMVSNYSLYLYSCIIFA